MLISRSRIGGAGEKWRQLSKLARFALVTTAVCFVLALLWGTGTVDVDYMRDKFKALSDTNSDEPIPEEKNETPIIDGVPNDQNDRPIPEGVLEEPEDNQRVTDGDDVDKDVVDEEKTPVDTKPVDHQPHKETKPEKTTVEDTPAPYKPKPIHTEEEEKPGSKALAGGVPIRVMFIGASMTLGDPPQGAYRKQLQEWMISLGNKVNSVGVRRFGQFKDNDVQAYPATPIKNLHKKSLKAIPEMQPNLIIVNAGSSDCFQEKHGWGSAHGYDHTRDLLEFIFEATPDAAVIVSTLVPSTNPDYERCIKSMNAQIRQVALDLSREGYHVLLSEQHYDQGMSNRVTENFIKPDKMHPTFQGWEMMGEIYKLDILELDKRGWIVAPVENGIMADGEAEKDLEEAEGKDKEEKEKEEEEEGKDDKKTTRRRSRARRGSMQ
ncbi:hypothetical protein GGS20DRAFT_531409 [Poronia punctata]|nr:hypothetical protein GGS20DRAFT_531409 [Poronia punctata]